MSFESYLENLIRSHIERFFRPAAMALLASKPLRWMTYAEATAARGAGIVIPTDVSPPTIPQAPYRVPFNGTVLTLWNPLPRPEGWLAFPEETPVWYLNANGTLMPAWNLFGNCFDLLTLREERDHASRDAHGRFIAAMSPRRPLGLLEVPAVNEAIAALVGALAGLETGQPQLTLEDLVAPPVLVLSHDNDVLHGNDPWTQAVRLYRVLEPLRRGKPPRLANLWWALRNLAEPEAYYANNVLGMIEIERMLGFSSTFYWLNGTAGRFGARSGSRPLRKLLGQIPDAWPLGMHYNYDTLLQFDRFKAQKSELEGLSGRQVISGRAHYLRLDPEQSFEFWANHGIRCDESLGYPDAIGYRAGLAGIYQVYSPVHGRPIDLWEVPLVVMDGTLLAQYPENPGAAFEHLFTHLSRIGGAMTLLFHPGVFFNPEFPEALGLYRKLLGTAKALGAISQPATSLLPSPARLQIH